MARTHNEAIALFISGEIDRAWEVAKMDDGMNEGVTMDQWVAFASRCVENQKVCDVAYEEAY